MRWRYEMRDSRIQCAPHLPFLHSDINHEMAIQNLDSLRYRLGVESGKSHFEHMWAVTPTQPDLALREA